MIRSGERLIFYAGGSMWPTFRPGDRLVLEECDARSLRPGEVVVFRGRTSEPAECAEGSFPHAMPGRTPRLVCHRVLSVREEGGCVFVRTQGDASRGPDPDWPAERLVGRVVELLPAKGRRRRLRAQPFLGWRMRHRLSLRRLARALARRLARVF